MPEQHTDFIFTAVGEDLGFIGGAALLLLYALLAWRLWRIALLSSDFFGTLVAIGVLAMFAIQIFENVGMTMGIMPITGIPLPVHVVRRIRSDRFVHRDRARAQYPHAPLHASRTESGEPGLAARPGLHCPEMSDLWPRIEPLLARVEKPARYIGMEMGTEPGNLAPRHGSGRAAFLLIYPDTYEIGLPNQGLQILYELLNEREDSVAERGVRALDRHGVVDAGGPGAAVQRRHPPRRRRLRRAWPSTFRPSSSTRTS